MKKIYVFILCLSFVFVADNKAALFDSSMLKLEFEDRVIKTADSFLNSEVSLDPLGEGFGLDPDPLISTRKFDCTTFVEVVLAISLSKKEEEIIQNLNQIRYKDGKISYFNRNHFMVSDWIPENSKTGLLSPDLMERVFPKEALKRGRRQLNKTTWFFHRVIDLLDKQGKSPKEILSTLGEVPESHGRKEEIDFLLAQYFRDNSDRMSSMLPKVSVIMFIRNMPTIPTLVTHMGLCVKEGSKLYLYHAPRRRPWRVLRELLEDYFKEMDQHRAPIQGLLLYKINSPK
ncbi:MAG: N-acetylmuramoyl-L-alanine amidase-like domain-containing protein [bacterium]